MSTYLRRHSKRKDREKRKVASCDGGATLRHFELFCAQTDARSSLSAHGSDRILLNVEILQECQQTLGTSALKGILSVIPTSSEVTTTDVNSVTD